MGFLSDPVPSAACESYESLEEQAARIEKQISLLRTDLARIRERRNALVPINSIPDEVLLSIFALLVQTVVQGRYDVKACPVLDVSRTCRRWRRITVNDPTLWVEMPLYSVQRANLFAQRSGSLPVRLCLEYGSIQSFCTQNDFYDVIRSLVPRLRVLYLHYSELRPILKITEWSKEFPDPAPLLEELSLCVDGSYTVRMGAFPELGNSGVPPEFSIFGNSIPALRSLTLDHVSYPSISPLYHNLRRLNLSRQDPHIPELLRILRRCPELETLALEDCVDRDPEDDEPGGLDGSVHTLGLVKLPHLTYFQISGATSVFPAALLQNFDLPITTCFSIITNDVWAPSLPRLPATLPALSGFRSLCGVVDSNWAYHCALTAGRGPDIATSECLFLYPTNLNRLSASVDTSAVESYVLDLVAVASAEDLPAVDWRLALQDLPALRTLRISGSHGAGLVPGLLWELSARADAPLACLLLEKLELAHPVCDAAFWGAMKTMVEDRRAVVGSPFRRVSLEDATEIVDVAHPSVQEVRALLADDLRITSAL